MKTVGAGFAEPRAQPVTVAARVMFRPRVRIRQEIGWPIPHGRLRVRGIGRPVKSLGRRGEDFDAFCCDGHGMFELRRKRLVA